MDPIRVRLEDTLDLHSFMPADVASVVDEYLRAAHAAGLRVVRLVHGRGIGAQRGVVHRLLHQHQLVEDFWDAPESHLGATVARLIASPIPPEPGA